MSQRYRLKSNEKSVINSMSLNSVRRVAVDNSFAIEPTGDIVLVAIRTIAGKGSILFKDGETIKISPNTLFFCSPHAVEKCLEEGFWQFWLFEFTVHGPFEFPFNRAIDIPLKHWEEGKIKQISQNLYSNDIACSKFATAIFCCLLYEYGLEYKMEQTEDPYRSAVFEVIRLSSERIESPMTVFEMAAEANMSERNFRTIFKEITGNSPKNFCTNIRMQRSRNLLLQGNSVAKVAHLTGFSDASCFSNAFAKHYGFRPSNIPCEEPESSED